MLNTMINEVGVKTTNRRNLLKDVGLGVFGRFRGHTILPQCAQAAHHRLGGIAAIVFVLMAGLVQTAAAACPPDGFLNANRFSTLNAAISRIGTSSCTLLVSETAIAIADDTVPENVELWFTRGGVLVPKAGVEVRLEGPIRAPEDQIIFDVESGGTFAVRWSGQIIANWWSGVDIGKRWNNMRNSLDLRGRHSRSFKVVGEHSFSTSFNMTGFRNPGDGYTVDFGGSRLRAVGIEGPALDLTNSRGFRIYNLRLTGERNAEEPYVSPVGVLLARNSKAKASGQHIFSGAFVGGEWEIAAVYNVESEVNHFIGGNYNNEYPGGRYIMFFGRDNPDGVKSLYEDEVFVGSTATQQNLSSLRLFGQAVDGIYVRGFSNVRISDTFMANAGESSQITLDNEIHNIGGIEVRRFMSVGNSESALRITGGRLTADLIYDQVGDRAREYSVNIESGRVEFSEFRVNSGNDFRCGPTSRLEQVRIEVAAENQARHTSEVILGELFVGEIYMSNPDTFLRRGSATIEATIHDMSTQEFGRARTRIVEKSAPTLHLESMATVSPATQSKLRLSNAVSTTTYDWQIYGKGQLGEGQLAIRELERNVDVLTIEKNGFVGIGTEWPNAQLQVNGGDVAVATQGHGLILQATNGPNCFRVTVDNAGTLASSPVACP